MQSKFLRVVLKSLLCCGLFVQSSAIIQAVDIKLSTIDQFFIGAGITSAAVGAYYGYAVTGGAKGAAVGGAIAVSVMQGIYNIRSYNQVLSQCQSDYVLPDQYLHWLQYPSQFGQDVVCLESPAIDMTYCNDHAACMIEAHQKIKLFEVSDPQSIWRFEAFKDTFPHTDSRLTYRVSKSYLGLFGYPTLGILKTAIACHIAKIKVDFELLKNLTSLSWSDITLPKDMKELDAFEVALLHCCDYYGAYTLLGAFGWSSVHNGQRIKGYLVTLAKMHAFFINFQELLRTCSDNDDTELINAQGLLNFSLQHVQNVQHKL